MSLWVDFLEPEPDKYAPRHLWYLRDAEKLIVTLQHIAWRRFFHIALGGGVLNHGYSDKDLDIYVLPNFGHSHNYGDLVAAFEEVMGPSLPISEYTNPSYKNQLKFDYQGKRVDVFIVNAFDKEKK